MEKDHERTRRLSEISKELLSGQNEFRDKMKDRGWTLLHFASFEGRDDLVAQVLCVAPDLADQATIGIAPALTALDLAIEQKHESVVLRILEMCPNQAAKVTRDGETVLDRAASEGFHSVVEHLLATNPTMVTAVDKFGLTALHNAACKNNNNNNMVSLILAANPALIDATTNDGWNVLHFAASGGNVALVASLLTEHAMLTNAVTNDGRTAMHIAAAHGHLAMVQHLLAASPDLIHVVDHNGWNAVHSALFGGHSAVAVHLLIEAPNLVSTAGNGRTVLALAAEEGLNEVVAHILKADPTLANADALTYAVYYGHIAVAEQLLAANPGLIDAVAPDGFTPFTLAVYRSRSAIVSYFLGLKPELIDTQTEAGHTPLHLAARGFERTGSDTAQAKSTIEILLAMKPELVFTKDNQANMPLHTLVATCRSREVIEAVWRLNPEALHAANTHSHTPFQIAVMNQNDCAIDLFHPELTWEEIESAYNQCETSYVEKFKPVMKAQCEGLRTVLLPDVVATVFEYLGFERVKHGK